MLLAQFAQGFFLDLPYALPRKVKALSNLLQRQRVFAANAEVQPRNLCFARFKHG